jgi:hypothetical protein
LKILVDLLQISRKVLNGRPVVLSYGSESATDKNPQNRALTEAFSRAVEAMQNVLFEGGGEAPRIEPPVVANFLARACVIAGQVSDVLRESEVLAMEMIEQRYVGSTGTLWVRLRVRGFRGLLRVEI